MLNKHYNNSNVIFSIKNHHGISNLYEDPKFKIRYINGTILVITDISTFYQDVSSVVNPTYTSE